ncbi:hypothetical protein CKM354_000236200 [Cercospora kikuchii]|uniref:RRM domain-containing protein n=1 Tax=Cercospora kikuchii TaxID=84275 RepID=A0A9P3CI22_9PEZI|nr:uncharacterized protein CKM354_000236200 [Cercospora kikuchii]GIZ38968.1 hypothetical protein CKM354_000236200 [Cercospora kikuchii]
MADGDGIRPPVIASSSRFNDILPYCKILFEEESKRWGGIMPHQFPQNASKEAEEEFLLTQFPASECQVQGFRFLKQVWYSIAINNRETRLPHVVNEWFEHKSKEYVGNPDLEGWLLREEACAATFFEQKEIDVFGSDFLDWAVQGIQWRLRNPQVFVATGTNTPEPVPVSEALAPSKQSSPVEVANAGPVSTSTQPTNAPAQPSEVPAAPEKQTAPVAAVPSTSLSATAAAFSSTNTPVQAATTVFKPSGDAREYVANAKDFQPQTQRGSKRAPNGKRRGQGDRNVDQTAPSFYNPRAPQHAQQPLPSRPMPAHPAQVGPMPPGPPTYIMPSSDMRHPFGPGHPAPTPHMMGPHPPPGFEHHPQQPVHMGGHGMFMQGPPPPQGFGYPSLSERNMNHGDARAFPPQPTYGGFDQGPDQGRGKGRDSTVSSGGRGATYGSVRGRSRGRGRNSISRSSADGDYSSGSRYPSHGFNDASSANNFQRAVDSSGSWRSHHQDENAAPEQRSLEQFSHGPPRILTRRSSQAEATGGPSQYAAPVTTGIAGFHGQEGPTATVGKVTDSDMNEYHCTKTAIGDKCIYAHKLIAFLIPATTTDDQLRKCFTKFGPVERISPPLKSHNQANTESAHRYITFETHHGARECVKQRHIEIMPGVFRDVEVAKEHWDPEHQRYQPRTHMGVLVKEIAPAPPSMHYVQKSAFNALPSLPADLPQHDRSDVGPMTVSREEMSAEAAPAASGAGTPKGKKKTGKRNKKKASDLRGEAVGQAFEENAQKGRAGLSPIPDDTSSNAETVVTVLETKHTTPTKRKDSLRSVAVSNTKDTSNAPAIKESSMDVGTAADPDDTKVSTPIQATKVKNSLVKPLTTKEAQERALDSQEVSGKNSDASSKSEDEHVDDSFHTASATPGGERNSAVEDENIELKAVAVSPQAGVSTAVVQEPTGEPSATPTQQEQPAKSSEEEEKVQLPDLSKSKSKGFVAVPKLDTSAAADLEAKSTEERQSAMTQGGGSGSSEAPVAPFVTAPNTPASPILDNGGQPQVQSKKEGKAKEEAKVKGPAQTESFSLFGKQKKAKKQRAPKGGNSGTSSRVISADLPKPDEVPMRKATSTAKPEPIVEGAEAVEDRGETFASANEESETARPTASTFTSSSFTSGPTKAAPLAPPEELSVEPLTKAKTDTQFDAPGTTTAATTMTPENTNTPMATVIREKADDPANVAAPGKATNSETAGKDPEPAPMSSAPSPGKAPGIFRRITGIFVSNSDAASSAGPGVAQGLGISSEPVVEASSSKVDAVPDQIDGGETTAVDGPSDAATSKPAKKSKKKKSKKKPAAVTDTSNAATTDGSATQPNAAQPTATKPNANEPRVKVLEMSHLYPADESSLPLYAFRGTRRSADTDASTPDKAKAPRVRRVHPRVKHRAKSSSDTSDSREVSTQSHGQAQPQSLSTPNEGENEENNDARPKLWIFMTVQDPVERSRAVLQELDEREKMLKRIKAMKELEMGRVIGEAEDEEEEVENGGENNSKENVGAATE